MNSGIKLWRRAKKAIPGGNGLLSKRPERYAPGAWPTYYDRAKGVYIWDMDGNRYIDMAQMGIGTAILGYNDPDVNRAVEKAIDKCVNTTLNAPEEVYLAERLLRLNPFAGGVKFARTGGEAMAIAVRIARAYSGKDKVLFSGYHGWSDWYLASNIASESNLEGHLLPGLKPKGVPYSLKDSAIPFRYNDFEEFERLAREHDAGVVVIEGARYELPKKAFLESIKNTARAKGMVIVVDEITSGWRATDGGVYKILGFKPDIVVYGKAMGNGYAISAILGRKEVMDMAQESFISSTFWTERIGFAAALATIKKIIDNKTWQKGTLLGTRIGEGWERTARECGLKLHVTDFKPLVTFKLDYGSDNPALYTIFTKEMLKKGYIASNSIYVSYAHTEKIVDDYLNEAKKAFKIMKKAVDGGSASKFLKTPSMEEGFKRLT